MGVDTKELESVARALVARDKGILAADESQPTMAKRLAALGIENTEEQRRRYRQLLFTTPELGRFISGVILFDETIRQHAENGSPFPDLLTSQGIVPGIKVDKGTKPLAGTSGELITEGLDGLRERLAEYRALGARFAKWRAVITIGSGIPSQYCLETNAHALARYAVLCQEGGLVPIVEPEVLMDGDHLKSPCTPFSRRWFIREPCLRDCSSSRIWSSQERTARIRSTPRRWPRRPSIACAGRSRPPSRASSSYRAARRSGRPRPASMA